MKGKHTVPLRLALLALALAPLAPLTAQQARKGPAVLRQENGAAIVNTTALARDVKGHGGPTPVEIYIKNGKVEKVVPFRNAETPTFWERACKALLTRWNGKKPAAALKLKVDAVSGATYSSRALIENVRRGLQHYKDGTKTAASATVKKSKASRPKASRNHSTDAVSGASPMQ